MWHGVCDDVQILLRHLAVTLQQLVDSVGPQSSLHLHLDLNGANRFFSKIFSALAEAWPKHLGIPPGTCELGDANRSDFEITNRQRLQSQLKKITATPKTPSEAKSLDSGTASFVWFL